MKNTVTGKLSMKDVIVTSVLGVICIAVRLLFMILGGIVPAAWFISHMLDAIFIGPIYMLIVAKVRRNGPVFLIGLVTALAFFSASAFIPITEVIGGLLAEAALRKGNFENKKWVLLSYGFFSFGFIGDFFPLWLNKEAFLKKSAETMNADYLSALGGLVSAPVMVGIVVSVAVGAVIGGLFGLKLMRKHFIKAGVAR